MRVSVSVFNDDDDIDRLVEALAARLSNGPHGLNRSVGAAVPRSWPADEDLPQWGNGTVYACASPV